MTSWTTPKTWTAATLAVSDMNTHVRDNENYLKERLGYLNLDTTLTGISNSASETDLWTVTYPGNEMTATGLVIFRCAYQIYNNKGSDGTYTIKFYVGANSVTLFNAVTTSTGTYSYHNMELWIWGNNSTSSQTIGGGYSGLAGATTATGKAFAVGTTATDITANQTWKLTGQLSAASASFTVTPYWAGITYNLMTV